MAFLNWSRHRRRVVICRFLACTLSATLLCLIFFPFSASSAASTPRDSTPDVTPEWHLNTAQEEPNDQLLARSEPEEHAPIEEYPSPIQPKQEPLHEEAPKVKPINNHASGKKTSHEDKSEKIEAAHGIAEAMRHITTLFPDELQMRGLLAPFAETGEAHVRDLGLRVRLFKQAFEAWEALHLVNWQGSVHQQDVIQKLRQLNLPDLRRTIQTYDRFRYYVNKLADHLFPWTNAFFPDHMSLHATLYGGGRGIVMTAGNDQAQFILTSIPSFRELGCQLPIEILYLGDGDLDEEWRDKLEAMPGVITRDLSHMINDEGWTLKGWAAKPFAMLMSSFREVLFIDADALFFVDPETLFEDEGYVETGALFFTDRNLSPQNDKRAWLRQVLPKPISEHVQRSNRLWTGESVHMQDSGVVLVDKWRHFVPMLLTTRLNGPDRDGDSAKGKRGVYDMVYGDKETFWLSWELAGDSAYSFHDSVAGSMGVLEEKRSPDTAMEVELSATAPEDLSTSDHPGPSGLSTMCSPQLLHFDRQGKPLWWNGWIATSKFKEDHGKMAQFDVYVKEPQQVLKPQNKNRWDIRASNVVCLRSDDITPFTSEEHAVLDMIQGIARQNTPD